MQKYQIEDLIDIAHFQKLQDLLHKIYPFPSSIIDNEGNILTATGWQDVCTHFHRKNRESEQACINSDLYIRDHLHEANPAISYRCPHGLVDNALPIIIDGIHYCNFFTGQFFLETRPDMDFFKAQAKRYGYDETAYLEAIQKVPTWSQEQLTNYLQFIHGFIEVIAESGLKRLNEIEHRKRIEKSEKALRESEEKFAKAFYNSPVIMSITAYDDGTFLDVNRGFSEFLGLERDEVIGKKAADLGFWDTNDRHEMLLELNRHGSIHGKEVELISRTGQRIPLLWYGDRVTIQNRECIIASGFDLSRQKALEADLLQAQKMESVGRLAGGVAHDFNNMLGVILGHAEMAMETLAPSHPLYTDFNEIQKAANRSADLTRQLLGFARKQAISPKVLDLNKSVEEALKMLHRLIGENIELVWKPAKELMPVKMDPSQIDQILVNLCVNARDAIDGTGKIVIETANFSLEKDGEKPSQKAVPTRFVMLSFSDNGCGIDPKALPHIFEPFYTTKAFGKGTGLGLATLYGIVKQNKGRIDVSSEPEKGTTLKIYLPPYRTQMDEISDLGIQMDVQRGHETILLVEDEPAILIMTRMMLERLGYNILSTEAPSKAIRMARDYPGEIHLLLTDVVMPKMNGLEMSHHIMSHYPEIKRLFMSGYTANVMAEHGVLAEGIHLIQKPFSKERLGDIVRDVLDNVADHGKCKQ